MPAPRRTRSPGESCRRRQKARLSATAGTAFLLPEAAPALWVAAAVADHADADAQENRGGCGRLARPVARNVAAAHPPPAPGGLPGWPLLMDAATARRFTSTTRAQFDALIGASGRSRDARRLLEPEFV